MEIHNNKTTKLISLLTTERLLLLLFFITTSIVVDAYGPDVYLHLTAGQYIFDTGALPHTDIFSYTRPGEPWIMHEWLFQIIIHLTHDLFGAYGIQILSGLIITAVVYFTKQNCKLVGASDIAAWLATISLFATWLFFVTSRPQNFTYLFFVLTLYFLLLHQKKGQTKPLYFIPLIMIFWVNSHGGFIVGIVLVGYFSLISLIGDHLASGKLKIDKDLLRTLVLTIIASLINPYGAEQLLFPFQLMDEWVMKGSPEWMPPDYTLWNYQLYLLILAFFTLSFFPTRDKRKTLGFVFALPFIVASLDAVRHIPIAAFVIAPYLGANLTGLITKLQSYLKKGELAATVAPAPNKELGIIENIFNWLLLCIFIVALYYAMPMISAQKEYRFNNLFPVGATEFLIDNNIQGRMFTLIQYSNYILYHRYPEQKLFYDVRLETYGKDLTMDYVKMANAIDDWESLYKHHNIDYVVLCKAKNPYAKFTSNKDFSILYEDEYSLVLSHTP